MTRARQYRGQEVVGHDFGGARRDVGGVAGTVRTEALPAELRSFLTLTGTHVLLIRGPAGTGKTIP